MFLRLFELLVILFVVYILANIIRGLMYKTAMGGGFWGLANWMTKEDREKEFEKAVAAEVARREALGIGKGEQAE